MLTALKVPLAVLIHEIGHALDVILFSKEKDYVYLGANSLKTKQRRVL